VGHVRLLSREVALCGFLFMRPAAAGLLCRRFYPRLGRTTLPGQVAPEKWRIRTVLVQRPVDRTGFEPDGRHGMTQTQRARMARELSPGGRWRLLSRAESGLQSVRK
jgi:hypothetical protein